MIAKDKYSLSLKISSLRQVNKLLDESRILKTLIRNSDTFEEFFDKIKKYLDERISQRKDLQNIISKNVIVKESYAKLSFQDYALLRLYKYQQFEGKEFTDLNRDSGVSQSRPFYNLWMAAKHSKGIANEDFFKDFLYLFRQLRGELKKLKVDEKTTQKWMRNHKSGLDRVYVELRQANKMRIINTIINIIDRGDVISESFHFTEGFTRDEKVDQVLDWWEDYRFHLKFAARTPERLNEYLDNSLRAETLAVLQKAFNAGIPIFVNPYYASLISVDISSDKTAADISLRDYIFHSEELVNEFGKINAWEKEDIVEEGKPNEAGWVLPGGHNIHRRYPEVAIFIPETGGRACGGLCVSCQRMYDFQSGHFNFNLSKLKPKKNWPERLTELMKYFEEDEYLQDILITGGDSLMSTNTQLKKVFEAILIMIENKKRRIEKGEKLAAIQRIRLGTRLPVYLPQRMNDELIEILKEFKSEALKLGVKQFIIQTHIQSAMEVTPQLKKAVSRLQKAGWLVTNQLVFTAASSRRGHTIKLRQVLNELGILPYYTFSVKGFRENYRNSAPNARLVQEKHEEKKFGILKPAEADKLAGFLTSYNEFVSKVNNFRKEKSLSFIATDRSVMNLPGVGKSNSFVVIGITDDGRRILEFEFDHSRNHSPMVDTDKKVIISESKSIRSYLSQMKDMGEDSSEYRSIWGYSINFTEELFPVFDYRN